MEKLDELYNLLEQLRTDDNEDEIEEIKHCLEFGKTDEAMALLKALTTGNSEIKSDNSNNAEKKQVKVKTKSENKEPNSEKVVTKKDKEDESDGSLPKKLQNRKLEEIYLGLLLSNPKSISMYYFLYEECYFESDDLLNIYKSVLFTEGQAYASEIAKRNFNFAKATAEAYELKNKLLKQVKENFYNFEKVYTDLKKLFILRKNYLLMPIKEIQNKIVEITDYELYNQMSAEEIEAAVNQVTITNKFKQSVLTDSVAKFLLEGDNNLTNGLDLPFPVLSSVFKGIRKGETMAYAMPSNSGKSRFTANLAAYIAFVHKKKVLVISNEMSEEKMKLCLITTILNNPEIQKLHGQKLSKTEGELLEFKFRPDNVKNVEVDKDGFVLKLPEESQKEFVERLCNISTEFNQTLSAIHWLEKQIDNKIHFINITDHTNDELQKVIINYYYKEKIEYVFYDTLKADTENIGNSEEIKKTATILSNIAQNFNIFIASSLQLAESNTLPINLNVNDLAVSRTVKEVLDTLCLFKQINRDNLSEYEYSLEEVDTKFYPLKKYDDPDVRYYACVVDKNRAGAKPRLVFKLNLAYNEWVELGYLRLKQNANEKE